MIYREDIKLSNQKALDLLAEMKKREGKNPPCTSVKVNGALFTTRKCMSAEKFKKKIEARLNKQADDLKYKSVRKKDS